MGRYRWIMFAALFEMLIAPAVAASQRDSIPLVTAADSPEAIEATVGGRRGLFMFDSGLGTSALTPSFAAAIGCKPWGKVTGFRATGERLDLPKCNETSVTIGSLTRRMPQLSVIDLERLMGPMADKFSGALGLDAFAGHKITIDISKHEIMVEDQSSLEKIMQTEQELPIRLVKSAEGAALTADLGIRTSLGFVWMEIDTGNYGPSLVDDRTARLVGLEPGRPGPQKWTAVLGPHLDAAGSAVVKDLIMDGDIGRDVLKFWSVTLDLENQRGWIKVDRH